MKTKKRDKAKRRATCLPLNLGFDPLEPPELVELQLELLALVELPQEREPVTQGVVQPSRNFSKTHDQKF